jgi:GAF domain-containing protein
MSVALENARLCDEAQRRARETTALAEVGREISSTLELSAVMDRIAQHAKDLLHADNSAIFLPAPDGRSYRAIVALGDIAEQLRATEVRSGEGIIGSLLVAGRAEFVNDTGADPRAIQLPGTGTDEGERMMVAPLVAGEDVKGAMAVWRTGGRPFDASELEFLVGLSRQATVAVQNARLYDATREALSQQTATADILRVISRSPTDVQPVFDAIVGTAARLLACDMAFLLRCDRDTFSAVAGATPGGPIVDAQTPMLPIDPDANFPSRAIVEKRMLHLPDWSSIELPPQEAQMRALRGINAALFLPLLRESECFGVLALVRKQPGAFSDQQIALAESFRDQAVIAIENVRLFNETK